jgi:hypothetical protein
MSKEFFPADAIPQKPLPEISELQALTINAREIPKHDYGTKTWEPNDLDLEYFRSLIKIEINI